MVTLLNTVDTGHEDIIHGAELDYYGLKLATCSSDSSVKIFDVKNGQVLIADLKGHNGPVWQIAWAHPKFGNILASCSYDRKVLIWKENNNEWSKMYEYNNHDSSVNSIAWAPYQYGLILACGSSDGSISVLTCNPEFSSWECKKITNAHTIGCNAVSWCPSTVPDVMFDQKNNVSRTSNIRRLVSGGCDNCVKIWKEENDRWVEESRLESHSDWVRDVAWAPSVLLPKSQIASASQDRHVIIWNSDDFVTWSPTILHTFDDVVWGVSWSLTGNILAVTGGDNKVSLWKENVENQWTCINEDASNSSNQNDQQRN